MAELNVVEPPEQIADGLADAVGVNPVIGASLYPVPASD